jgi:hypothetical protein
MLQAATPNGALCANLQTCPRYAPVQLALCARPPIWLYAWQAVKSIGFPESARHGNMTIDEQSGAAPRGVIAPIGGALSQ